MILGDRDGKWFCRNVMSIVVWDDSQSEIKVVILRFQTSLKNIEESLVKRWKMGRYKRGEKRQENNKDSFHS